MTRVTLILRDIPGARGREVIAKEPTSPLESGSPVVLTQPAAPVLQNPEISGEWKCRGKSSLIPKGLNTTCEIAVGEGPVRAKLGVLLHRQDQLHEGARV